MICDQCGLGLTRWIKVVMPGGREYLFCCEAHLVEFFCAMENGHPIPEPTQEDRDENEREAQSAHIPYPS